jgi:chromosome segregation ATPase
VVTRDEFDGLRIEVEALRRRVESLDPTVEEHEDRLDGHETQLDALRADLTEVRREVRALSTQTGRMADALTAQAPVVERMARHLARVLEILEPRTVVTGGG